MSDRALLSAAFSMLSQPVVLTRKEMVVYMNGEAVLLAGKDYTGKPASLLLPNHILHTQAELYTATAFFGKKSCIVKVSAYEGLKIYAITCIDNSIRMDEMLLENITTAMTNIKFASSRISAMAEGDSNPVLGEYACSLNRSYYRLKHTIGNVSLLRELQSGTAVFRPEPTDISELCKKTIEGVKAMYPDLGISISLNAEEHLRTVVDSFLITQLLLNLISNSIGHCRQNGKISVSLLRAEKHIILTVDDNGDGISPEKLPQVLDRYRYGIKLNEHEGAGMGLAVVRGIAEKHDGAVIIESRGQDRGTTVRVMLSSELSAPSYFGTPNEKDTDSLKGQILTELSYCLPTVCYAL